MSKSDSEPKSVVVPAVQKAGWLHVRRPYKFNAQVSKRICDCIRKGNYMETAAAYAGVHKDTLYEWLKKGRAATSGQFHQFAIDVDLALAEAEILDLSNITRAAKEGVWQASAWKLERMYPERWGRMDRVKVEADVNVTEAERSTLRGNILSQRSAADALRESDASQSLRDSTLEKPEATGEN